MTKAGVGTNRYGYSANDPVNLSDPGGNIFGDLFKSQEASDQANQEAADSYNGLADSLEIQAESANQLELFGLNRKIRVNRAQAARYQSRVGVSAFMRFRRDGGEAFRELAGAAAAAAFIIPRNWRGTPGAISSAEYVGKFPGISAKVSQKQYRHIGGRPEWTARREPGYMSSMDDAQAVLDAALSGEAKLLGYTKSGAPVVEYRKITGFNNNRGPGYFNQPTTNFIIKGTASPSIVPTNPYWAPN